MRPSICAIYYVRSWVKRPLVPSLLSHTVTGTRGTENLRNVPRVLLKSRKHPIQNAGKLRRARHDPSLTPLPLMTSTSWKPALGNCFGPSVQCMMGNDGSGPESRMVIDKSSLCRGSLVWNSIYGTGSATYPFRLIHSLTPPFSQTSDVSRWPTRPGVTFQREASVSCIESVHNTKTRFYSLQRSELNGRK